MSEHRTGRWVHAKDALSAEAKEKIEAARLRDEARRTERVAAHGWPSDVECPDCGDTGIVPEQGEPCLCVVGWRVRAGREAKLRRVRVWESAPVPKRFRAYSLDGHPNREAAAAVLRWVEARDGSNLYVTGPVGVGKTGLAAGALRALVERDECSIGFWSVPDLMDRMRPNAPPPDPMEGCRAARWLVLDDLGAERPSDWVRERLYVLVNGRYEDERPTIVSSNCDLPTLEAAIGERTVSRLAESITVVALDGEDLRRRG